ncbi:MAG: ABC transporter ATP-binding protein [Clostridiales Family XIII bacterium]|jgi:iron complex transport system ATP-binding protein|nr:ABC transporter ATP-binding protein [Clostridiales Family XIII bacterium]
MNNPNGAARIHGEVLPNPEAAATNHEAAASGCRRVAAPPLLSVNNLRTGYHRTEVVKGISFTAERGDFVCVIGANGCGKTTALKGMLGILPLFGGSVDVGGREFLSAGGHTATAKEFARTFAYIPQIHGLPFPFLVSDVVLLGRTPHLRSSVSSPSDADKAAAYMALKTLGIESIAGSEYTALSGGQQQLVLIARALAQEPRILIMDEPTASLDFGNQQLVLDRMLDLGREGMAVIMVTHDPAHVLHCANKVIVMDGGSVLREGTPEETITAEILERIYGARAAVTTARLDDGSEVRTVVPLSRRHTGAPPS